MQTNEYRLSKEQRTTVKALAGQRQMIMDEANKQIGDLNAAIQDLARRWAAEFGAQGAADFEGRPDGSVVLVVKPPAEEASPG